MPRYGFVEVSACKRVSTVQGYVLGDDFTTPAGSRVVGVIDSGGMLPVGKVILLIEDSESDDA